MQNEYEVKTPTKINKEKLVEVAVPGSKSITNRALLLAAMAEGTSEINHCLTSDDASYFLECLETLGFTVKRISDGELGCSVNITGCGGDIPCKKAEIYVGSAGTAARFLAAMLAFSDGEYIMRSSEQMKKRPMQPLVDTLREAGAVVECLEEEGHFPMHIIGARYDSNIQRLPEQLTVNIEKSSQFLSALLIAAGALKQSMIIHVTGTHGLSYIELTVKMMQYFGVSAKRHYCVDGKTMQQQNDTGGQACEMYYSLEGNEHYRALSYDVEPDMSAAAYFYAASAILGSIVTVRGVNDHMLQGDTAFLDVLVKMGCSKGTDDKRRMILRGPEDGKLTGGFAVDMSSFSDQALTLAAIAPYADAPVTITGIGHIRLQECDRIKAIVENLTRLGIKVEEQQDAVTVYPGTPRGCKVETYDDHRVAMSFALTGLRTKGIHILKPSCCKKTFAQYFDVLEQMLAEYKEG